MHHGKSVDHFNSTELAGAGAGSESDASEPTGFSASVHDVCGTAVKHTVIAGCHFGIGKCAAAKHHGNHFLLLFRGLAEKSGDLFHRFRCADGASSGGRLAFDNILCQIGTSGESASSAVCSGEHSCHFINSGIEFHRKLLRGYGNECSQHHSRDSHYNDR